MHHSVSHLCITHPIAATEAAKGVIWLERLFCGVLKLKHRPVLQVIDNSAAVKLAQNPEFHCRTKHIDVKHFFALEKVIDGSIDIIQISGGRRDDKAT